MLDHESACSLHTASHSCQCLPCCCPLLQVCENALTLFLHLKGFAFQSRFQNSCGRMDQQQVAYWYVQTVHWQLLCGIASCIALVRGGCNPLCTRYLFNILVTHPLLIGAKDVYVLFVLICQEIGIETPVIECSSRHGGILKIASLCGLCCMPATSA